MAKKNDFIEALRRFRCDPRIPEKAFHRELKAYLESSLSRAPLKVITEAGISGTTTRVDLHAVYGSTDYLITVKRGVSAQKVKTLTGEVREILRSWRPSAKRETFLAVVVYGENPSGGDDHLMTLSEHLMEMGDQAPDVNVVYVMVPGE